MAENNSQFTERRAGKGLLDKKVFDKYFLLAVFLLSLVAFVMVIWIFIVDIILAAVFATLFYPLFAWFLRIFKKKTGLAALLTCIIVLMGLLIPIVFISNVVIKQGIEFYRDAVPQVLKIVQKGDAGILGKIKKYPLIRPLNFDSVDWQGVAEKGIQALGNITAKIINKTSKVTLGLVFDLFIILFTMFYFFRDGPRMLLRVKEVIPLSGVYKDRIISRFSSITRATVRGILLIALIQSFIATITLWIFGISTWLLWGAVMLVLAIIPFLSTGIILIPAGIIKILSGDIWSGVAIIAVSILVVSTIDNFLRPRLVGRSAGMHDLLVFISTLGGIGAFGASGFIVGPLIAATFLTVLDIFSIEFRNVSK